MKRPILTLFLVQVKETGSQAVDEMYVMARNFGEAATKSARANRRLHKPKAISVRRLGKVVQ